jgi:hypothetical protein
LLLLVVVLPLLSKESHNKPTSREAKVGDDWQQERLMEAFGKLRQKWLATRALMITHWREQEMDHVRGNQYKQQPTIDGNSNTGGDWQQ